MSNGFSLKFSKCMLIESNLNFVAHSGGNPPSVFNGFEYCNSNIYKTYNGRSQARVIIHGKLNATE